MKITFCDPPRLLVFLITPIISTICGALVIVIFCGALVVVYVCGKAVVSFCMVHPLFDF